LFPNKKLDLNADHHIPQAGTYRNSIIRKIVFFVAEAG
jgi:hypothetical protein